MTKPKWLFPTFFIWQKMEISVEDASVRFLDELYEIEKQSFKEEAFSKRQIAYLLADYNAISIVARVEGKISGFVIGRIDLVWGRPVGHIMTLDVAPTLRRRGVATRLMLETEKILRQKGIRECFLEVRENNVAALGLYTKLGYCRVSDLEHYYGREHGLYLRKTLIL